LATVFFAGTALTATVATFLTGALVRGAAFLVTFFSAGLGAAFFAVATVLTGAASLAGAAVAAFSTAGDAFSEVTMLDVLEINEVYSLYRLICPCQD
jgi:hypothetical protein